jgi:hypothetical protein
MQPTSEHQCASLEDKLQIEETPNIQIIKNYFVLHPEIFDFYYTKFSHVAPCFHLNHCGYKICPKNAFVNLRDVSTPLELATFYNNYIKDIVYPST